MPGSRFGSQTYDAHAVAMCSITVDGALVARFSELVELSSEHDSSDLVSDSDNEREAAREVPRSKRLPGIVKLRRGQSDDLAVFRWHREAAKRDAVLVMYASDGDALDKYLLASARPTKLETTAGPPVGASAVLYETVTIACEDIERVSP